MDVDHLEPVTDSMFVPGQVWRYQTRPGEESSMFVVGAVDRAPEVGRVVHIRIVEVAIKSPNVPGGVANILTHLPMHEEALRKSVLGQVDETLDLDGFQGGYDNWLDAYEGGNVHLYFVSLAEALTRVEAAQNR